MSSLRSRARLVAATLLFTGAVAAAALAVVTALPAPTPDERLAVRVVQRLQATRSGGAVVHLDGGRVVATCRRLSGSQTLVRLDDGTRLVVARTRVHDRSPGGATRGLAASRSPRERELLAVKAALAGIHRLYARSLRARLMRRADVIVHSHAFRGERALRVPIGAERPAVELVVSERTLLPLAVTYRSRRVSAWSRLLPAPRRPRHHC